MAKHVERRLKELWTKADSLQKSYPSKASQLRREYWNLYRSTKNTYAYLGEKQGVN